MSASASQQPSASIWRRFMGMVYEGFLLIAIVLAYFFLFSFLTRWTDETSDMYRHASQLVFFLMLGGYFVWCWTQGRATLPMQTLQMTLVERDTGEPLKAARAALRYLLAWPSTLTLIGVIWVLIDRDRQSLHDRLAGTRLIATPGPRQRPSV